MKKIIIVILFATLSFSVFAQNPLQKGAFDLNAGLGFSGWGLPIYFGFDYGVHKDITIGGEISYRSYNDDWDNHNYNHRVIGILGNGNYHFNSLLGIPNNWDFYAGLNLGFYTVSSSNGYNGSDNSGLGLGAQIGGRYFFNNKFGLNLEFGGGNSVSGGKFGITIKL